MMYSQDSYMVIAEEKLKKLYEEAKVYSLRQNPLGKGLRKGLASTMRHLADRLEPQAQPTIHERML